MLCTMHLSAFPARLGLFLQMLAPNGLHVEARSESKQLPGPKPHAAGRALHRANNVNSDAWGRGAEGRAVHAEQLR